MTHAGYGPLRLLFIFHIKTTAKLLITSISLRRKKYFTASPKFFFWTVYYIFMISLGLREENITRRCISISSNTFVTYVSETDKILLVLELHIWYPVIKIEHVYNAFHARKWRAQLPNRFCTSKSTNQSSAPCWGRLQKLCFTSVVRASSDRSSSFMHVTAASKSSGDAASMSQISKDKSRYNINSLI